MRAEDSRCKDCQYFDRLEIVDQYDTGHCRAAAGAPITHEDSWCEQFKESHLGSRSWD